jgi:hypothetical protein
MPRYSDASEDRIVTCDIRLQRLFRGVLLDFDHGVMCGHRDEEEQNRCYDEGFSTLRWPNSKHNHPASRAIDVLPSPCSWHDTNLICTFAGYVLKTAQEYGIPIRWGGGRCTSDMSVAHSFNWDLAHFEFLL